MPKKKFKNQLETNIEVSKSQSHWIELRNAIVSPSGLTSRHRLIKGIVLPAGAAHGVLAVTHAGWITYLSLNFFLLFFTLMVLHGKPGTRSKK
ncbi:MAG TPA: hypothetical protein VGC95_04645 [Chitinophagaceae bacterium]